MVAAVEAEPQVRFYFKLVNGIEVRGTVPGSTFDNLLRDPNDISRKIVTIGEADIAVLLVSGMEIFHVENIDS